MLSSCLFHFHAIPNPFSRVVFFPDVVSSPFQGFISKSCASYEAIKTNPFSGCNIFAIIFKWFPFSGRGCFHPVSSTFMESQIPSQGVAFFPDLVSSPFQGLPFSGFHIQELCLLRCNQNKSLFRVRSVNDYSKMLSLYNRLLSSCLFNVHGIPSPFSGGLHSFQISFPLFRGSPLQGLVSNGCASYDVIKTDPFSGCDVFTIILKWFPFSGRVAFILSFPFSCNPKSLLKGCIFSRCRFIPFSGFHIQELC